MAERLEHPGERALDGLRAIIGVIATTCSRRAATASRTPSTARIGSSETNGLEGASTIASASRSPRARRAPGARRHALEAHGLHRIGGAAPDEPLLELELAGRRDDARAQAVVGRGQQAGREPERRAKSAVIAESGSPARRRSLRTRWRPMSRSPRMNQSLPPSSVTTAMRLARVARDAPALLRIDAARERVEHRVEIGRDREAPVLEVVADVADDRDARRAAWRRAGRARSARRRRRRRARSPGACVSASGEVVRRVEVAREPGQVHAPAAVARRAAGAVARAEGRGRRRPRSRSSCRRRRPPARAGGRARAARARRRPSRTAGRRRARRRPSPRVPLERERDAAVEIAPPSSSVSAPSARATACTSASGEITQTARPASRHAPTTRRSRNSTRSAARVARRARRRAATCRVAAPSRAPGPATRGGNGLPSSRVYDCLPPQLPPLRLGYKASAEQFAPAELLSFGLAAERLGLDSVAISDHFQPFRHDGGHSPASLPWLGALAAQTSRVLDRARAC